MPPQRPADTSSATVPRGARPATATVGASTHGARQLVRWVHAQLERAGWPPGARADVVLAVDEAVQNAVEHGSPPGATVAVGAEVEPGRARLIVRDRGRADQPTPLDPPELPDISDTRGRGRVIMEALADDVTWRERGEGTEVELVFTRRARAPRGRRRRVAPPETNGDCSVA